MLGKTAGGLFWMFRYLERAENIARLFEAGYRIALTSSASHEEEWSYILTTVGCTNEYLERHETYEASKVVDFLLRDKSNASSVISVINAARNNARLVRTALTREVWEAVNDSWLTLKKLLSRPIREADLTDVLGVIRHQTSIVRGALHGTMLRNDIYNFARMGTFLERCDNTARILDVKYYVLLPSVSYVGSSLDNVQWEAILRSASAERAYRWLNENEEGSGPTSIVKFLILDRRMPRSLRHCTEKIVKNLAYLFEDYGEVATCHTMARDNYDHLSKQSVDSIFQIGLHEFLEDFLTRNNQLGQQIEADYRFYE